MYGSLVVAVFETNFIYPNITLKKEKSKVIRKKQKKKKKKKKEKRKREV